MTQSRAARAYVADANKASPKRAFTLHINQQIVVRGDRKRQATADAAAYDGTAQSRPMKPLCKLPKNAPQLRSPGSRGLEQHKLTAPAVFWTGEGWRF